MKKTILPFLLIFVLGISAFAQEGKKMTFQGSLYQSDQPFNGTTNLEFSIALDAGATWTETIPNVNVINGLYSVVLGSINPIPADLFYEAAERALTVKVDGVTLGTVTLYAPFAPGVDTVDVDALAAYILAIGTDAENNAVIDSLGNAHFNGDVSVGGSLTVGGQEVVPGAGGGTLPEDIVAVSVNTDSVITGRIDVGTTGLSTIATDGSANFELDVDAGGFNIPADGSNDFMETTSDFLRFRRNTDVGSSVFLTNRGFNGDTRLQLTAYDANGNARSNNFFAAGQGGGYLLLNDSSNVNTVRLNGVDGSATFSGTLNAEQLFVGGQEVVPGSGGSGGAALVAGDSLEYTLATDDTGELSPLYKYKLTGTNSDLTSFRKALMGMANTSGWNVGVHGDAVSQAGNNSFQYGLYGSASGEGTGLHYGVRGEASATNAWNVGMRGMALNENLSQENTGGWFSGRNSAVKNVGIRADASGAGENQAIFASASGGTSNYAAVLEGDVSISGSSLGLFDTTGASFSVAMAYDANNNPNANDYTAEMFLKGRNTPNIQMGGQPWANGDLANLTLYGSNPDGGGWFYGVANMSAGRDNGSGEEWGNLDIQYNDGANSFSTFNVDGRNGNVWMNGENTASAFRVNRDGQNVAELQAYTAGGQLTVKGYNSNVDPGLQEFNGGGVSLGSKFFDAGDGSGQRGYVHVRGTVNPANYFDASLKFTMEAVGTVGNEDAEFIMYGQDLDANNKAVPVMIMNSIQGGSGSASEVRFISDSVETIYMNGETGSATFAGDLNVSGGVFVNGQDISQGGGSFPDTVSYLTNASSGNVGFQINQNVEADAAALTIAQQIDVTGTGNGSGESVALRVRTNAPDRQFNTGFWSEATGTGSNANYAIYGQASNSEGTNLALWGIASGGNGVSTNYGVYGQATGGAVNWAGYFDGSVNINGSTDFAQGTTNISAGNNGNGNFGTMTLKSPTGDENKIFMGFADGGDSSPFVSLWQNNGGGTDEYGLFNVVQNGPGGAVYGSLFLKDDLGNSVNVDGFGDISATGSIFAGTDLTVGQNFYSSNMTTQGGGASLNLTNGSDTTYSVIRAFEENDYGIIDFYDAPGSVSISIQGGAGNINLRDPFGGTGIELNGQNGNIFASESISAGNNASVGSYDQGVIMDNQSVNFYRGGNGSGNGPLVVSMNSFGNAGSEVYGALDLYRANTTDTISTISLDGFNGDITTAGTINGTTVGTSDRRLKKDIVTISNAIDITNRLRGVRYTWNENAYGDREGTKDVGVIAQEVEEVLPELVFENKDGYKAVNYSQMTAVLIEAIKELNAKVESLETENAELKADAANASELESRIAQIEKLLGVKVTEESNASNK